VSVSATRKSCCGDCDSVPFNFFTSAIFFTNASLAVRQASSLG
jgi:hypothetical protein